ncbi:hypothetical protein AB4Y97_06845 [Microvirga sp. 2TAF3]
MPPHMAPGRRGGGFIAGAAQDRHNRELALGVAGGMMLGNIPPAFAISAFSLGTTEQDGLATLACWGRRRQPADPFAAISSAIVACLKALFAHLWILI